MGIFTGVEARFGCEKEIRVQLVADSNNGDGEQEVTGGTAAGSRWGERPGYVSGTLIL